MPETEKDQKEINEIAEEYLRVSITIRQLEKRQLELIGLIKQGFDKRYMYNKFKT